MEDFTLRSHSIDVEKIMDEIRLRIREKRGVDYTEAQIRELAQVKLDKLLDPDRVRSGLLDHYLKERKAGSVGFRPPPGNFSFADDRIYVSSPNFRGRLISGIRRLLRPVLKMFFNPTPIIEVLQLQSEINAYNARLGDHALQYELLNNLVVEVTRLSIETKNQKMQIESLSSRLEFDERRARALERVVQYRPGTMEGDKNERGENKISQGDRAQRRRQKVRETKQSVVAPDGNDDAN